MTQQLKAEAYVRSQRPALKIPTALPLPVKYDGVNYFWGGVNEMIADQVSDYTQGEYKDDTLGEPFRLRGWGRIQYMQDDKKTPYDLQNEVGYWIAEAINAFAKPSLHDWLAVLGHWYWVDGIGDVWKTQGVGSNTLRLDWKFNMETGQPATEFDYKTFNDLVGV